MTTPSGPGSPVHLWTVDRGPCRPQIDASQLVLQEVDVTESVFTRQLVKFPNASLPAAVRYQVGSSGEKAVFQYTTGDSGKSGSGKGPPLPTGDHGTGGSGTGGSGSSGSGTGGSGSVPPPGTSTTPEPPTVFQWDLYLMLKYRQDVQPAAYGLGELIFSTSLLPNEELTLELKTWETSRTQLDKDDQTEERNASDVKNTSSMSAEATNRSESKEHESVDAKAGYSGFGFSADVTTQWSNDVDQMQSTTGRQAQERSEQESHELRRTRKVRLAVTREQGSESKSIRRIRNINQTRTLNVNYFEVLRQSHHALNLYDATLVLLGPPVDLSQTLPYSDVGDDAGLFGVTVGRLLRQIRSEDWFTAFVDRNGVSPVKLLRDQWAAPLQDGALTMDSYLSADSRILSEERDAFRDQMLQYVRPTPGWIEPDEAGGLRWGYEIFRDREPGALAFLYGFLPTSPIQLAALVEAAGADRSSALLATATRYAQAVQPSYLSVPPAQLRTVTLLAPGATAPSAVDNDMILVPGPFHNTRIILAQRPAVAVAGGFANGSGQAAQLATGGGGVNSFGQKAQILITNVIANLSAVRDQIDNPENNKPTEWSTTVPTHGVYADLSLGVCSGAEDYIEIQRQLDLERRQLENERLRLENQRLAAGQPVPALTVDDQTGRAQLRVDVDVNDGAAAAPSRIDIRNSGS